MQNNYNTIRKILKLSFIAHDDETINAAIRSISYENNLSTDKTSEITLENIYLFLLERLPLWIIHFEAYSHEYINPIITYLVVEKMRNKNLEATKRKIQEVCFYAQNLYDDERAESFSHAVNSAVKVYIEKDWVTPYGFIDVFTEYLHEIN